MNVLFCHDGPLRKDELNNLYGTAHNDETFSRYYTIADTINVAIRINNILKYDAENQLSKITVPNFNSFEIPNISSLKGTFLNRRKAEKRIEKAVQESDYIVVRLPSVIGFIAFDYAKKINKPCLVEVVACPWDAFWNHSLKGKIVAPFMFKATRQRVRKASHVVYVTNEFLQRRYPTNGESVNCSNVALQEFNNSVLERRIDKINSMRKNDKLIIGTTAAVDVRFKGQQYIIKALGKLKERGITNYEYQLVGGGCQLYLKKLAEKYNVTDQVKFFGSLPHKDIFSWLDTIDIYAQPSKQEGLPRALIEAMSRGLPSLGANTAGIPELLDEKYIFSNSKQNVKEICNLLESLNVKNMKMQAERNYAESLNYDKKKIEIRRNNFFEVFKDFSSD